MKRNSQMHVVSCNSNSNISGSYMCLKDKVVVNELPKIALMIISYSHTMGNLNRLGRANIRQASSTMWPNNCNGVMSLKP